jgi:hypothetical protein
MPKLFRVVTACLALFLAASFTLSAAASVQAAPNPAFVVFWLAPKKIVCVGEKAQLVVDYQWDEDSGLIPLAPLFPINPKGKAKTPAPPGKLTVVGALAGQIASIGVGYSGRLQTSFKAKTEGQETLTATLAYGSYVDKDPRSFQVKKCNYNLVIKAWDDVDQGGTVITSYFSAEGKISIGEDGSVSGELREDAWFDISSDDPILRCELIPLPMATGSLTVSGTKTSPDGGPASVNLNLHYGAVEGFPESVNLSCDNKIDGSHVKTDNYSLPPSDNPGQYLLSALNFTGAGQLTGTFGKTGVSYYILEELQ